jgi:hypothetical protein
MELEQIRLIFPASLPLLLSTNLRCAAKFHEGSFDAAAFLCVLTREEADARLK